ncbi:MAG: TIGR03118 family protein, partial [Candidatus Sulfotelmatobacter sp.]
MKSARFLGKAALILALAVGGQSAFAQYREVNLVSTSSRTTPVNDPNLVNGWGVAFFPDSPFWVSDEATGKSTLYDQFGDIIPLVVTIPPAPSQPFGPVGSPTGIIANPTQGFSVTENGVSGPSAFIFATLDGTISGWAPSVDLTNAIVAVDNSASFALYSGLAYAQTGPHVLLYAADAVNNRIDIYNTNFKWIKSFGDPNPPAGLSVYGVQVLNNQVYVTYASPVPFAGGALDVFDLTGNFIKRLSTNGPGGPLEGAWGMAWSPNNFGPFSNDLLVGNVDNGHINAFDPSTGNFLGSLQTDKGTDFH